MPPKKKGVSSTAAARARGREKEKAPSTLVDKVPVEVMVLIFKYLYHYTMVAQEQTPQRKASPGGVYRDKPCTQYLDGTECGGSWQPNRRPPERPAVAFTYHLHQASAVCRQWWDVIRSLPEYWARVVIFVDLDVPAAETTKLITRSKDLPLDLRVTRSNSDEDTNDQEDGDHDENSEQEYKRAQKIMKLLAPLVPRCRSFVFDLKYSSSLPLMSQYFRGTAPHLRVLKLQCEMDRNNVECPQVPIIEEKDEFIFPKLSTIVLDGCTFMDACKVPSWTRQMKDMYLDTLSISLLSPPHHDEDDEPVQFNMYKFAGYLAKIGYIRHLALAYVNVAYEPGTEDEGYHPYKVDNLTLQGQDQPWVEEFNLITFGWSLCYHHLIDSSIAYESMMAAHHLRLERIKDFGYSFDGAIARHFGNRLDIVDCEGLTDHHLDVIAKRCYLLRRLYLVNCPNITVQGLKGMITTRENVVDEDDDERLVGKYDTSDDTRSVVEMTEVDDANIANGYLGSFGRGTTCRPIHRLHIQGHPHKLSKAEYQWFKKRLDFFSWG